MSPDEGFDWEKVEFHKLDLMTKRQERFPGSDVHGGECPICGWDVSSHGLSQYGLDCPGGGDQGSPASREGRLNPYPS